MRGRQFWITMSKDGGMISLCATGPNGVPWIEIEPAIFFEVTGIVLEQGQNVKVKIHAAKKSAPPAKDSAKEGT